MNMLNPYRRGAVLLQTLVMSLLLAFIAVSMTRLVLNRYMGAARTSRSSVARGTSQGGSMLLFTQWNTAWPVVDTTGSMVIGGKTLEYGAVSSGGGATRKMTFTFDEEQP
ncbi:MAG: hypothetical protein A2234_07575 [Elusimicrobia bacterium RIFOXYA2_FULL_58_8]|nr:MAG: hypothetical protein A2234_07575 [Elusimicrobia bacterium RIFOXYA2_FULL_58_8]